MLKLTKIFQGRSTSASQKFTYSLGVIAIGLVFGLSIQFAKAWTNPTATPPGGNVAGPINTSAIGQTKAGPLTVSSDLTIGGSSYFGGYGTGSWFPYVNGYNYLRGNLYFNGALYDEQNPGYYIDPNNASNFFAQYRYYGFNGVEYDANNSGYYVDPSGTTNVNTLCIRGVCQTGWPGLTAEVDTLQSVMNRGNSYTGPMYDADNTGYYLDPNSTSRLNYGIYDNLYAYGWLQSPFFYDANNNGYYLDPNSTSNVYYLARYYGFNGPEYDVNNGAYYVDPNGTTNLANLCINGVCNASWPSGADNLGNHVATTTLNMAGNSITAAGNINATGEIVACGGGACTHLRNAGSSNYFRGTNYFDSVLYDENNPGYYLDPNGTSNTWFFQRYYGFNGPEYDVNNGAYYVDPNATSRMNTINADTLRSYGNVYTDGNYGNGLVGVYDSTRYQGVFAMGDAYKLAVDGSSPGNLYGLAWTHSNVGGQSISGLGHQLLVMSNGGTTAAVGNGFWTSYTSYLPFIYDTQNTGYYLDPNGYSNSYVSYRVYGFNGPEYDINNGAYYVDPNGTTNLANLCINGVCNASWPASGLSAEADTLQSVMNRGNSFTGIMYDGDNSAYYINPNGVTNAIESYRYYGFNGPEYDAQTTAYYADPSSVSAFNDMRVNILYDRENTGYYLDPNGTSNSYASYRYYGFNGPEYDVNNGGYYVDPHGTSRLNYGIYDNLYAYGWMQAPNFLDANNNGYYLDPDGYSNSYVSYRVYGFNGPEYDINNGAYYVDPNGTTNLANLCINGVCNASWPASGLSAEADTLQTVTSRGASTTANISANTITTGAYQYTGAMAAPRWDTSFYVTQSKHFYGHNATEMLWLGEYNPVSIPGDIRTPIMYDYNNTGYYVDPNSASRMSSIQTDAALLNWPGYNGISQAAGHYLWPGSYDRTWQQSWYLRSGPDWGLYTNTSMLIAGGAYAPAFYYYSDESLKADVTTIPSALDDINKLRGVNFTWKKDGKPSIGLIAQEVEKVYPELIGTDTDGLKWVQYGNLVGPLVEAVKEVDRKIETVMSRTTRIEEQSAAQQTLIEAQQRELETLRREVESINKNKLQ